MSPRTGVRIVVALAALLGGVVVGVAAVGLHRYWWGFLLALAATAAILVAVPGGWWRRLPFALGWLLVVLQLAQARPEGDLLITSSTSGYLLLAAGVAVLLGGIVGLREPPVVHGRDAGSDAATS